MKLTERIKAKETRVGRFVIKLSLIAGTTIAAFGEFANYAHFIPEGFIPTWVKGTIGILALSGVVYGKLTVEKNEGKEKQ